jgi:hypothetical protein
MPETAPADSSSTNGAVRKTYNMLRVDSLVKDPTVYKHPTVYKDLLPNSELTVPRDAQTKLVDWDIDGDQGSLCPAYFSTGYGPHDWIEPMKQDGTTKYKTDEDGSLYTLDNGGWRLIINAPVEKKW